jgi:hypothetical protein
MKVALGLPLSVGEAGADGCRQLRTSNVDTPPLLTGLAGLDYASGGMAAGELLCVAGPPATGKTVLLLDLAARICGRYGKNVVFWSAHQPCHYLVQRGTVKDALRVHFLTEPAFVDLWDLGMAHSSAVVVVPSSNPTADRAHQITNLLTAEHPRGCAALVMDGWSTAPEPRENVEFVDGIAAFAAERWPHALLSAADVDQAKRFARVNRLPVVIGVKTASLVDDEAPAESFYLEERLRKAADRWVTMHRPELYVETSQRIAADRHVVCLSGTSPRWWDRRSSRMKFDPGRLRFQAV